jgi:Tfp pilus assembly protein PilF
MSALAKVEGLRVAGRTSSFSFKGTQEELSVVGGKLGVAHILEGSVRKSGKTIRVTAQLVNAADGFQLWSETYDRTLDDIFAVQDDIATSVAAALELTLLGRSDRAVPDAEAYDLILQARFIMQRRTEETIVQAHALLERALEIDPDYAPAWAEMGLVHLREFELALTKEDAATAQQAAKEALDKALELDPELAEAHSRMAGWYSAGADWNFAAAQRSIEQALALDPKNPIVLGNAGLLLSSLGRYDEAIALTQDHLRIEPLALMGYLNLGTDFSLAGRFVEAEDTARKLLELSPDYPGAHAALARALKGQGRLEEALEAVESETRASAGLPLEAEILAELGRREEAEAALSRMEAELPPDWSRWQRAIVYRKLGLDAEAERALTEVVEQDGGEWPLSVAQLYAVKGDADKAFRWLDRALKERDLSVTGAMMDEYLRPLHADPRWKAFLKRAGFPVEG